MIALYAITDHSGPPLPDVAPLRTVTTGDLAAVCAPAAADEVTAEALWQHEGVVEALMDGRDLLPVRYGTRLEDEAAVAQAVTRRHDELAAALNRVRGAVELSVRAVTVAESIPDRPGQVANGAEYLRAKGRDATERETARRTLHEPLARLARVSAEGRPHSPREVLRAAYLVDRAAVESFVALVARLQETHPALRLLCTGPWPPYSFAEP